MQFSKHINIADDYIWVVTDEEPVEGQRGWGSEVKKAIANTVQLPMTLLEQNMNHFLGLVGRLFRQVDQQIGTDSDMRLDEVELSIEISGRGEVKLVAGAEAKGAITLKFKRVEK
ncbi:MAG: hypothetical protein WBA57_02830 [Elainellaceae cyanobacterium]